jgi:hypothetical protein
MRSRPMPFSHLIQDGTFDPDTIEIICVAYEGSCKAFGIADRTDPLARLVAKKIIALTKRGERDPDRICDETLKALR